MKTIFLDFDGVLHPEFCHESKHFCCLPFFEQVLREVGDCEVVVTSTWRLHLPLPSLRNCFSADIAPRVVDVTDQLGELTDVPEPLVGYPREAECHAWRRAHGRLAFPWLAIDDRSWLYRPFNQSLFLVDGKVGLTHASAFELLERLQRL